VNRQEILDRITAIARPAPFLARGPRREGMLSGVEVLHAIQRSMRDLKAWDVAHPDLAAEHHRLVDQLEVFERHETASNRAMRLAERAVGVLERSGAGERSLKAAASPQQTHALEAAQLWMSESPPRWALMLRGDVGTGKTVAACWSLRRAALQGESVAFRKSGEVTRLSGFAAGADELRMLKGVGLLVIDDVGAESLNEWGRALLVELLDYRYEENARTVLTANPPWEAPDGKPSLVSRLGQRIVDRLRQGGRVVELEGRSMRRTVDGSVVKRDGRSMLPEGES
jgi:DNA replication protein DnaC